MAKIKRSSIDSAAEKRREQVRINMKRMRERIKADAGKYEEYKQKERERYFKRKERGKIKVISELNDREKRAIRKEWKERSRRFRLRKKETAKFQEEMEANTPPPSPRLLEQNENSDQNVSSRQKISGRNVARKNREKLKKENRVLQGKVEKLKKKVKKYKRRAQRAQQRLISKSDSPNTEVNRLLKDSRNDTEVIKRKLLFGEVLSRQLKENFKTTKSRNKKRDLAKLVTGKLIKKYKFAKTLSSISSPKLFRYSERKNSEKKSSFVGQAIQRFLEKDESSRILPGKKDVITRRKNKKQKRLLNDSMLNLYRQFKAENPKFSSLSYTTFCRYRPFWILSPSARTRDTCLCIVHENMLHIVKKLRMLNIIDYSFPDQLCKSMCCENQLKENCLSRNCGECKNNEFKINTHDPEQKVTYKTWKIKKETITVKGQEKITQKTVKEEIEVTCGELITQLKEKIPKYMVHLRNIFHQYQTLRDLKTNLSTNSVVIHMDFSENYQCKYSQEVQSAHFGGSKPQVSLHTVVFYYQCQESKSVVHKSCVTVSDNLRHDPVAIYAHLQPIFTEVRKVVPDLKCIHFQSDGPATQYKSKKMFYILANRISTELNLDEVYWHYSESGHGKGAPDGIGAAVKQLADSLVARGADIPNFQTLVQLLSIHKKKVTVHRVSSDQINQYDKLLPENIKAFKGTMQIHGLIWSSQCPLRLQCLTLSCLECPSWSTCSHYHLGNIDYNVTNNGTTSQTKGRLRYRDVYSPSDSDEEAATTGRKLAYAEGQFVMVKFAGKKRITHFVGQILSENSICSEYTISFFRKKGSKKFVFPDQKDVAVIDKDDVVCVLSKPSVLRGQYFFSDIELSQFKAIE